MNTPESIVVSLDKAIELKVAGWPQYDGEVFGWFEDMKGNYSVCFVESFPEDDHYAAPTASELWRFMPVGTTITKKKNCTRITIPCIVHKSGGAKSHAYESKREQDALAYMWIYLSKNNLLPKA